MSKKIIAMVLVGGRGTRLEAITKHTAKPAVSFAGKYRLIDFVLSNLTNSTIDTVGIVTQYEPHDLMNYIQRGSSWDLDMIDGGIHFLTPYTSYSGENWQKGTAHAIYQHRHFIKQYQPKYVLILSGDHVYKMDYTEMIKEHEKNQAEITIALFKPDKDLSRFGIVSVDETGKIIDFEEKPSHPKSDLASMGIYIFNTSTLRDILTDDNRDYDFGKDVIPHALKRGNHLQGYIFNGYFRDVGTVESLFEANMELIDHPEYLKLHDYKNLPLYTKSEDLPPHHNLSIQGITDSLISDGSIISGKVNHSIVSSRVWIKDGAFVDHSIVYHGAIIGEYAELKNCIVLEDTVILPRTKLRFDEVKIIDNETLWSLGVKPHE